MPKRISDKSINPAWVLILITLIGSVVRIAGLTRWPMGLHQDEAYSAYNAWCLLKYGVDSSGYVNPVYYSAYGSGMNVLYSWLTMPFLALLGPTTTALRLPQAVWGSLCIPVAYGLGKELKGERFGLLFAALLAINPWHIKQSRYGIESNIAVPMFLIAVWLLARYLNGKRKSILGAAFFFGITLYAYAVTWLLVPVFLLMVFVFRHKRFHPDRYVLGAILILFALALPLMLFLAVNYGLLPEIRLSWISVPKLAQMRSDEFGMTGFVARVKWLFAILFYYQYDEIWYNTCRTVGSYYYISTPFILLGIFRTVRENLFSLHREKRAERSLLVLVWFGIMMAVGLIIELPRFYKLNVLHVAVILLTAYGIVQAGEWVRSIARKEKIVRGLGGMLLLSYLGLFSYFIGEEITYPVDYERYGNPSYARMNWNLYEDALDYAKSITEGDIGICNLSFPIVLWYERYSPEVLQESIVMDGENKAFQGANDFGRYHVDVEHIEDVDYVFVLSNGATQQFQAAGYTVEKITPCYSVAYRE